MPSHKPNDCLVLHTEPTVSGFGLSHGIREWAWFVSHAHRICDSAWSVSPNMSGLGPSHRTCEWAWSFTQNM